MQVKVRLFASLAARKPGVEAGATSEAEVASGSTIHDLIRKLALPEAELKTIFVNGRTENLDCVLHDQDEVGIFPAVGGG